MNKLVFSEPLAKLFKDHRRAFPKKRELKRYATEDLKCTFTSNFYSDARNGRPTPRHFLRTVLLYLKRHQCEWVSEHLQENWSQLSIEDLTARHLCHPLPEQQYAASQQTDDFDGNLVKLMGALMGDAPIDSSCRPATAADVPLLVQQLLLGIGDVINAEFLPPIDESIKDGLYTVQSSVDRIRDFFTKAVDRSPHNVWIRCHPQHPYLSLISIMVSVSETTYARFYRGEIDEFDLIYEPIDEASNCFIGIGLLGHLRQKTSQLRARATFDLLSMVWRQVANASEEPIERGIRVLAFCSNATNHRRLKSWGFTPTPHKMKRTGFDIMELALSRNQKARTGGIANLIWGIIAVYYTLRNHGRNRHRRRIPE